MAAGQSAQMVTLAGSLPPIFDSCEPAQFRPPAVQDGLRAPVDTAGIERVA